MNQVGLEIHVDAPSGREIRPSRIGRGVFSSRVHSRSASWSFTGSQAPRGPSDLGSSLAAINPLTSVIRELVPSYGQNAESTGSIGTGSRNSSQGSLHRGPSYDEELSNSPRTQESGVVTDAPPIEAEEQNIGTEIGDGVRWLEQNAIFFVLLLVKFAWFHRSGLMVILGMFGTYLHCNQTIKHQVSLKNQREKRILFVTVLFLIGNIYFVYYVFQDQALHNCLIFQLPHFSIDLWNLIWCICVTDYIIRFSTMAVKACVAASCLCMLQSRKKGKYYMLLEYISQFYRSLVPAPLWFRYLAYSQSSGTVFAIFITALYLMVKGALTLGRARELYRAFINFIQDPSYGTSPTREELVESRNTCPICQEDFENPLMLRCKHIFCDNCLLQWFDRQSTCPLCRASVASDPKWRDGATAAWPQIF